MLSLQVPVPPRIRWQCAARSKLRQEYRRACSEGSARCAATPGRRFLALHSDGMLWLRLFISLKP